MAALPLLDGAAECIDQKIFSSLHLENAKAAAVIDNFADLESSAPWWPLLMDPQTSGGLLAGVLEEKLEECLHALHCAGYASATVIGRCTEARGEGALLHVELD